LFSSCYVIVFDASVAKTFHLCCAKYAVSVYIFYKLAFILFQVPAFIMSRVRHQYQVECERSADNKLVSKPASQLPCLIVILVVFIFSR